MGGNSQSFPEYEFTPTIVQSNGQILASQYLDPFTNMMVTNINTPKDVSNYQNKLKNEIQQKIEGVNTFSPELMNEFKSIADAKKEQAISEFESEYEPKYRANREDFFSRLGTLDSSAYLDSVNFLEKQRQKAYSDIATNYVANLDTLKQNELNNRYAYINYLENQLSNSAYENNSYLNSVLSLSSDYNDSKNRYNLNRYNALNNTGNSLDFYKLGSTLGSALGGIFGGGTVASFL